MLTNWSLTMDVPSTEGNFAPAERPNSTPARPRFGGLLWRLSRLTSPLARPLAGKSWNPVFGIVEHRGRRTGRAYATPVAARRIAGGFLIPLAFGSHVDWYRNLLAAGRGVIRWRGHAYRVTAPQQVAATTGLAAFHLVERALLRIAAIDGFVQVVDLESRDQ